MGSSSLRFLLVFGNVLVIELLIEYKYLLFYVGCRLKELREEERVAHLVVLEGRIGGIISSSVDVVVLSLK